MFFDFSVTIPFSTTKAAWQETALKLTDGVIHHVEVGFPWGPAGLVNVTLWHQDHQVWPLNPGGSLNSDEEKIAWEDRFPLKTPYNWLKARCWNLDDTFDHTVELRFAILPEEEIAVGSLVNRLISVFRKVFRA